MPLRIFPRGRSDSRRRGASSSIRCESPCSMRLALCRGAGMNWLRSFGRNRQQGKHGGPSLDTIAGLHPDHCIAIEQNIHARAKLDKPDPLAAVDVISHLKIENDAARDQTRNLLEDYGAVRAFNGDDVLLVLLR